MLGGKALQNKAINICIVIVMYSQQAMTSCANAPTDQSRRRTAVGGVSFEDQRTAKISELCQGKECTSLQVSRRKF